MLYLLGEPFQIPQGPVYGVPRSRGTTARRVDARAPALTHVTAASTTLRDSGYTSLELKPSKRAKKARSVHRNSLCVFCVSEFNVVRSCRVSDEDSL